MCSAHKLKIKEDGNSLHIFFLFGSCSSSTTMPKTTISQILKQKNTIISTSITNNASHRNISKRTSYELYSIAHNHTLIQLQMTLFSLIQTHRMHMHSPCPCEFQRPTEHAAHLFIGIPANVKKQNISVFRWVGGLLLTRHGGHPQRYPQP